MQMQLLKTIVHLFRDHAFDNVELSPGHYLSIASQVSSELHTIRKCVGQTTYVVVDVEGNQNWAIAASRNADMANGEVFDLSVHLPAIQTPSVSIECN